MDQKETERKKFQDGEEIKMMLFGVEGVGKSTITLRFVQVCCWWSWCWCWCCWEWLVGGGVGGVVIGVGVIVGSGLLVVVLSHF